MTLEELLKNYGGNAGVSIDGYCEDSFNECLPDMKFWGKIKHRNVKTWNVIGGSHPVELTIELEKPQEYAITDRSGDYICKGSYVDMHIVNARGEFQISFEDIPEVMP